MQTKILSPKLDYITLKGFFYPHTPEYLQAYFLKFFGLSFDDSFAPVVGGKRVFYFSIEGIDLKMFEYHFEIEFHSTFFARYDNAFQIIKAFSKQCINELKTTVLPIRIDVARDCINYEVKEFFDICNNPDNYQLTFKGKSWCRELKSGDVETLYLNGPKSRWKLCIYDKTKELKKNWEDMSEDKQERYKDYLDQKVTRFELRVRSEWIKTNSLSSFFDEDINEEELCLKILGSWSKRRTIYVKDKDEIVNNKISYRYKCEEMFEKVFKTKESAEGLSLSFSAPSVIYDKDKVMRKLAKIIIKGELGGVINSFNLNPYLIDARNEAIKLEEQYRLNFERLRGIA